MKTIIAAWLMTAIQANGGIASYKITETEQICREIVCAASYGVSCSERVRRDAVAEQQKKDREDAWKKQNPKRAAVCAAMPISYIYNGISNTATGVDNKPCGPPSLLENYGSWRVFQPTDVLHYRCTEAKPED